MADTVVFQSDTPATPPAGTITATDDAGAAGQVQIIKLAISTDGSATVIPADAANGLDVDVTRVGGTVAVTQSGTWDEVGINDSGNSITVDGTVAVTGALTDTELRASPVPVSGTVTASGPLTDTQLRASDVKVTLDSESVAVTGPLTDTQLRASAVPVSDGGGALTVDGTVAATQSGTWNVGTVTAVTGITNPVAVTDNSGSLTVDGTVTANLAAGTNNIGDVDVLTIAAGDNNIGNVDIVTVPAPLSTTGGGTEATALRVTIATDSTGVLSVDDNGGALTVDGTITANLGATDTGNLAAVKTAVEIIDNAISGSEMQVDIVASLPAGTNAIGKLSANSGVDIGDVDILSIAAGDNNIGNVDIVSLPASTNTIEVVGDVAHDAAAAGNPLRVGGYAVNAIPAAVANGDAANIITDLHGRSIVQPYAPPEKAEQYTSPADITDTADDAAFSAVASTKHYITHFSAMCSHATTATWVYLKDGSTVIASIYCAAAGGGAALTFPTPLVGTANTAINVANATNSSATRVNVVGFQAP